MKAKLLATLFIASLCTVGLSSCADEEIAPKQTEVKKLKGAQGVEDGF